MRRVLGTGTGADVSLLCCVSGQGRLTGSAHKRAASSLATARVWQWVERARYGWSVTVHMWVSALVWAGIGRLCGADSV